MKLLWKLLRRHLSVPQLTGFFFANLLGMLIVMLSLQFYLDLKPLINNDDSGAIKSSYIILAKRVGGLAGNTSFSDEEFSEVKEQRFVKRLGWFTASQFKVDCWLDVPGQASMGTQMFFESIPDEFVDIDLRKWKFDASDPEVPIILPRNYLAIYNFGFARSRSLPQISEGMIGMISVRLRLRGEGKEQTMRGRVVGFSSRVQTILVPESFLIWSNETFAGSKPVTHSRLIMEVSNPADETIPQFVQAHGYEIDEDKLDAGKMMYFLKLVSAIVMAVGLLISALSFYVLILSIYLLVQKNTQKLQNLLLIGYSPARVALPYQLLTIGVNLLVLGLAIVLLLLCRQAYLQRIWQLFPSIADAPLLPTIVLGASLFLLVCVFNVLAVRRKIMNIWKGKGV